MSDHDERAESDLLLDALAATADQPPPAWFEAGKAAWTWRTIDAELATLVLDVEADELAGVRGGSDVRQLSFEASDLALELEVGTGPSPRLNGQLVPARRARVEVRTPQLALEVESDEIGRFSLPHVPRGPVSLRCTTAEPAGAAPVDTPWIIL